MEKPIDTHSHKIQFSYPQAILRIDGCTATTALDRQQVFRRTKCIFKHLEAGQYKIQYRVMLARYRGKTVCQACGGSRLKKEASYIRIADKSISDLVLLPVSLELNNFENIQLDEQDAAISKRLLVEITNRIHFLLDVGLGYLTINRLSNRL